MIHLLIVSLALCALSALADDSCDLKCTNGQICMSAGPNNEFICVDELVAMKVG